MRLELDELLSHRRSVAGGTRPTTTCYRAARRSQKTCDAVAGRNRSLDKTGNLKAVQKLLGHASIQTTADIYTDWDIDQLAATLSEVLLEDDE